jgi:gamma-glutamylcyclotransferase (GGCT)/AIG2-like uncharacterized protein YtfP
VRLFAYGTLMSAEGFRPALGARADALVFHVGRLRGWRRTWNGARPEWPGGAILNLEPDSAAEVVGVVVEGLDEGDWSSLEEQEATHLPREKVEVELEDGRTVVAQTYRQRQGPHTGLPCVPYEAAVQERARQAGPAVWASLQAAHRPPAM